MKTFYASDELVMQAMRSIHHIKYAYTKEESEENFYAIIHNAESMMFPLCEILSIRGNLYYTVVSSSSPFQLTVLNGNDFIILIDERAFYLLLTLCFSLQSLSPLAGTLEVEEFPAKKNYNGKFLLDIVKDIVFHTDASDIFSSNDQTRIVFQAAFGFIITHEIAHMSHGHLGFMESPDFHDFSKNDNDRHLTLRTLEMDADSSATSSIFNLFERFFYIQSGASADSTAAQQIRFKIQKQCIAGIYFAHFYLDALSSNFTPLTHPTGYSRFLTSQQILQKIMSVQSPESISFPELIRQKIVEAFVKLSGHISMLGHPIASNVTIHEPGEEPKYEHHQFFAAVVLETNEPLYRRWARLRPFLEKYQNGGILAPATAIPR